MPLPSRKSTLLFCAAWLAATTATQAQQRWVHATLGTGFFVSKDGHIITNAHVVKNCQSISVSGAATDTAKLIALDEKKDLAILQIPHPSPMVAPLRWNLSDLRVGQKVSVLGYPKGAGGSMRYGVSEIVGLEGAAGKPSWVQIKPVLENGNSGGPLLDSTGNVIGVVTGKIMVDTDGRYNLPAGTHNTADVAIPLLELKSFLDNAMVRYYQAASGMVAYADGRLNEISRNFIVHVRCIISVK